MLEKHRPVDVLDSFQENAVPSTTVAKPEAKPLLTRLQDWIEALRKGLTGSISPAL